MSRMFAAALVAAAAVAVAPSAYAQMPIPDPGAVYPAPGGPARAPDAPDAAPLPTLTDEELLAEAEAHAEAEAEVIVVEDAAPPEIDMRATTVVSGEALDRTRGRALAEALADVPGVAQLRSGSGMAKPIVRGQFGRRLLLLVDGVRHRAQDWGLDHAPEVDPFVAGAITVVRGASGVRYGPDAIGGAVLVEPPALPHVPGLAGELHLVGTTNGRGGNVAARLQAAPRRVPGLAWQLEGTWKRLAAPSTPDYALDNTGAREWTLGGTTGYQRDDVDVHASVRHYQADLGVCSCLRVETIDDFRAQLERDRPLGSELYRADFEIERPYQAVVHDLALVRGRWRRDGLGAFTATYAIQTDQRREYDVVRDATTGPQYHFRLTTHDADVSFEHAPVHLSDRLHLHGTAGVVAVAQRNEYGGLPLVPDHHGWGAGAYALERLVGLDFELEAGVRVDTLARTAAIERIDFLRLVRSDQLAIDACGPDDGDRDPVECASRYRTLSASVGGLYQLSRPWALKLDLSTASRPPNPDEQYLGGTSPTFPVLGLGKPDLGAETTYSASLTTTYRGDRVAAELSGFANRIDDYIEFAPAIGADGEPVFDVLISGTFPRFVTRAVDAVFWGVDGGVTVRPIEPLELSAQVSAVRAKNVDDDTYLVFIPADRARGEVRYTRGGVSAAVDASYVAKQRRYDLRADLAPPPDAYVLIGAEIEATRARGDHTVKLALAGTNLLDQRYRDYTSLLRYFADQPGWQLLLRLSVAFGPE